MTTHRPVNLTSNTSLCLIILYLELEKSPYNSHDHHCKVFKHIRASHHQTFKKMFAPLDRRSPLVVFSEAIKDEGSRQRMSKIFLEIVDTLPPQSNRKKIS